MSVSPGGPRKDINFPIESVTFSKDELDNVMEILTLNLRSSMGPFGVSAHFKLDLDIQVVRKTNKKRSKPCPKNRTPTPTPPTTGTTAGKTSG